MYYTYVIVDNVIIENTDTQVMGENRFRKIYIAIYDVTMIIYTYTI